MNFIANIIKRPKSIASRKQGTAMEATEGFSPADDRPSEGDNEEKSTGFQDLKTLLDSASEDLLQLEKQHSDLILGAPIENPLAIQASSSRDTIQQLLIDINLDLNQVSANEMEHLQAMSGELSPLAVKPTPKPSTMEQQKALAAALVPKLDVEGAATKFAGLPEFDETQIPELAPLSEMEGPLKSDQSDSDLFVECLSQHSERYTGDRSELEAYSSALNDVLEQQLSITSAATLENTFDDPLAVSRHNLSYEPMDVDEINETMEMLKDVLDPVAHQLLQQQFVVSESQPILEVNPLALNVEQERMDESFAILEQLEMVTEGLEPTPKLPEEAAQETGVNSPALKPAQNGEDTMEKLDPKLATSNPLPSPKDEEKLQENPPPAILHTEQQIHEPLQPQEPDSTLLLQETQEPQMESAALKLSPLEQPRPEPVEPLKCAELKPAEQTFPAAVPLSPPVPTLQAKRDELPLSPPIPTHRPKTAEELEFLALSELPLPDDELNAESQKPVGELEQHKSVPVAAITPDLQRSTTPLSLELVESGSSITKGKTSGPSSPSFPIKGPAEAPSHFPRSPHAPPEQEEMTYLEEAVVKPSLDRKQGVYEAGVIAKSPVIIQVTEPSPQKPEHLNEPLPTSEVSPTPLNGTIVTEGTPLEGSATFDVDKHQRCTFSSIQATEEKEEGDTSRKTFNVENDKPRRTFCLTEPSPQKPEHLNEILPTSDVSPTPLNGTFDSGSRMDTTPEFVTGGTPLEGSATFDVRLGSTDEHHRRTFSSIQATEELEAPSRKTFNMENDKPRRTFCLEQEASPAVEATEECMAGEDFEAMDVDVSMRVEEATVIRSLEQQAFVSNSPPIPTHQNLRRPPIHEDSNSPVSPLGNSTVVLDQEQKLSAKEQAHLSAGDEKDDVFVEHFGAISPVSDDMFKTPQFTTSGFHNQAKIKANAAGGIGGGTAPIVGTTRGGGPGEEEQCFDAEFQDGASNQNRSNNAPIDRSSLLLKFDPLLGAPVPVNLKQEQEQALLNIRGSNQNQNNRVLSPTLEELETSGGNSQSFAVEVSAKETAKKLDFKPPVDRTKKHAKMSVDVIDNDCNKTFDNSNLNKEDKSHNYNMDDLEKKIKNEVTRSEDIEKKLKEAEQREEASIKRITEKDKAIAKLNGVIEAYEKAIAELISEKEQQAHGYERQLQDVQTDRDTNYHHLTSLETTFSDLHVKYEKSKEMTTQLKLNEESLQAERKQMMDNLRMQEQRYDKMKSHAMQQLEIANKKLDHITREHADEVKKLKALLKKEEISRVSMTEQLQQKTRENADLLKICEELIYGKGQGGSS
nr:uncharacterized protein LOC108080809 isoform X3 [Drosophila kikkawai]